jgi:hypothetical protein
VIAIAADTTTLQHSQGLILVACGAQRDPPLCFTSTKTFRTGFETLPLVAHGVSPSHGRSAAKCRFKNRISPLFSNHFHELGGSLQSLTASLKFFQTFTTCLDSRAIFGSSTPPSPHWAPPCGWCESSSLCACDDEFNEFLITCPPPPWLTPPLPLSFLRCPRVCCARLQHSAQRHEAMMGQVAMQIKKATFPRL